MFGRREERIPWRFANEDQPNLPWAWAALPVAVTWATPAAAQALGSSAQVSRVVEAFNPLLDLATAVAYPLCFLMVTGGFLLLMCGNREKGLAMIKSAALGYIGLQLAPAIMQILLDVGRAMRRH